MERNLFCLSLLQLAQSVIELNNQIQQKDKEIQTNEAKSVSANTDSLLYVCDFVRSGKIFLLC